MDSSYGWIITKDLIDPDGRNDVGTIGPSNVSDAMMDQLKNGKGKRFRLYDDDRELYYEGRYIGELSEAEGDPLMDFGGPNAGCTYMTEEVASGIWKLVIG